MGLQIVVHSFRLLFQNLTNALRVSIGPYLLAIMASVVIALIFGRPVVSLMAENPAATSTVGAGAFVSMILILVLLLFVSSWVAVSWHRYVLLEEYPGMLPELAGRPVWPYLGRALLLTLIMIGMGMVLGFIMGLLLYPFASMGAGLMVVGTIAGIAMGTALLWVWMRLGLILPAVAVDRPITMGESWQRTAARSGDILVAVLILVVLNMVVSGIFNFVLGQNILTVLLSLIVNWISIMVGISILTTLYGLVIEGRSVD